MSVNLNPITVKVQKMDGYPVIHFIILDPKDVKDHEPLKTFLVYELEEQELWKDLVEFLPEIKDYKFNGTKTIDDGVLTEVVSSPGFFSPLHLAHEIQQLFDKKYTGKWHKD